MNVLDLFSGIGGFSLGLERAGHTTVAFCEIGKYPGKVLKKHWPDVPIYKDIRQLTKKGLDNDGIGSIDIICGGFPCQPFSFAGKRRGKEDDRHLWPEMLRIIREIKPTWVIGENVTGIIKLALDDVLSDLEREGYTCQTFIIPASAVGAVHRRERVWILAYTDSSGRGQSNQKMAGASSKQFDGVCLQSQQDDTNPRNHGLQGGTEKSVSGVTHIQGKLVRGSEAIGIVPNPSQPAISGICDGFPGRVDRVKALGNAVVPQIPEMIGRAINEFSSLK